MGSSRVGESRQASTRPRIANWRDSAARINLAVRRRTVTPAWGRAPAATVKARHPPRGHGSRRPPRAAASDWAHVEARAWIEAGRQAVHLIGVLLAHLVRQHH